jgi:predicted PurR-regulated permease PerM
MVQKCINNLLSYAAPLKRRTMAMVLIQLSWRSKYFVMENEKDELGHFRKKAWIVIGTAALVILLVWIFKEAFNVMLLLLAGALVALYFRGLARLIQKAVDISDGAALSISIVGSLLLLAGFFYIAGNSIQQQTEQIRESLPPALDNMREQLNRSSLGRSIVERAEAGDTREKLMSLAQSIFRSSFGIIGDIYIVLFLAIFFTVSPKPYVHGFVKLIPPPSKPQARKVIERLGYSLKRWLKGQIFAMFAVFFMTAIGLVIMGIPMWLILSLSAGLLNFIPNFGPLIAMIPAVLVGFLIGPGTALMVAGLYITVQLIESSLVTPQIQKKMIKVPPALIIIAQLFMGVLTGGWGLLLATPLMVVLIILVQELYINKMKYEELQES